jgi:hypothetical protein
VSAQTTFINVSRFDSTDIQLSASWTSGNGYACGHPVFSNPTTSLTSPSFGTVTSTLGSYIVNGTPGQSRNLQFAGALTFLGLKSYAKSN